MSDDLKLTELQLDALKEFGNIASGNAATALSQLIGKKIGMSPPSLNIVKVEELTRHIGKDDDYVAGILFKIYGPMAGSILLTFNREDALNLTNLLIADEGNNKNILSPLGESALKEAGNIIAGAYITALSELMHKTLLLSVPQIAIDMLSAIIDFIQIEIDEMSGYALLIKIMFIEEQESIQGHFYLLPDRTFLNLMLEEINSFTRD